MLLISIFFFSFSSFPSLFFFFLFPFLFRIIRVIYSQRHHLVSAFADIDGEPPSFPPNTSFSTTSSSASIPSLFLNSPHSVPSSPRFEEKPTLNKVFFFIFPLKFSLLIIFFFFFFSFLFFFFFS